MDREDLSRFVGLLAQDLIDRPDEWENPSLERYLDALSASIGAMDGFFRNIHGTEVPEQPSWQLIGEMLLSGKYYGQLELKLAILGVSQPASSA